MTTRVCAKPGCPKMTTGDRFCPPHTPAAGWKVRPARSSGSRVRGEDWLKLTRYITTRDRGLCHVCGRPGATEVDHVVPLWKFLTGLATGNPDAPSNLAAIHADTCHKGKTAQESVEAKAFYARRRNGT